MLGFSSEKPIIGMVHLKPLPGSPRFQSMDEVIERAVKDASSLVKGGVDGLLIENYGDIPFGKEASSLTVSALTSAMKEIKNEVDIPMGVNVLRNDWKAALSISKVLDLAYVRMNVMVGVAHTPTGIIEGAPSEIQRFRTQNNVQTSIWADIDVKHAEKVYPEDIREACLETSERGMADALISTGKRTGEPPSIEELNTIKETVETPVLIGSGLDDENIENLLERADGAIVGSYFKKRGKTANRVLTSRVERLVEKRSENS